MILSRVESWLNRWQAHIDEEKIRRGQPIDVEMDFALSQVSKDGPAVVFRLWAHRVRARFTRRQD